MGAVVELRGQSFKVLAEVTVDSAEAQGVIFKHGGAHGGHVLFIADGHLHYVYNFLGEREQVLSAPDPVPLGHHIFGVRYERTGTVPNSHTPVGVATLFVDGGAVADLADVQTHPAIFALAGGGIAVGRNTGSGVSRSYRVPFPFTGGEIAQVTVDLSGEPYEDLVTRRATAFARD
jgi:arylsulfatase